MKMDKDKTVNQRVTFRPGDGEDALPYAEIGGIQVYVYMENGGLIISAHFEDADPGLWAMYGKNTAVPVTVLMSGVHVFRASPQERWHTDLVKRKRCGSCGRMSGMPTAPCTDCADWP